MTHPPKPESATTMWTERNLEADIHRVWGEHGAHADVFRHMLKGETP